MKHSEIIEFDADYREICAQVGNVCSLSQDVMSYVSDEQNVFVILKTETKLNKEQINILCQQSRFNHIRLGGGWICLVFDK